MPNADIFENFAYIKFLLENNCHFLFLKNCKGTSGVRRKTTNSESAGRWPSTKQPKYMDRQSGHIRSVIPATKMFIPACNTLRNTFTMLRLLPESQVIDWALPTRPPVFPEPCYKCSTFSLVGLRCNGAELVNDWRSYSLAWQLLPESWW